MARDRARATKWTKCTKKRGVIKTSGVPLHGQRIWGGIGREGSCRIGGGHPMRAGGAGRGATGANEDSSPGAGKIARANRARQAHDTDNAFPAKRRGPHENPHQRPAELEKRPRR